MTERARARARESLSLDEEARLLLSLCKGDELRAFNMVQGQLGVLVLRTQVMLSLSGIVITVTGFSGRAIAQTGVIARASIAAGLFVVLMAAVVAIGGVLRLRWLTQILDEDPLVTLTRALAIREQKGRYLSIAQALFVVGFGLYCFAIAQLLMTAG